MSALASVHGLEALWTPIARGGKRVQDHAVLPASPRSGDAKGRLARVARRAPEVMVKITGKTRDAGHLRAHLEYISRDGALPLEGRDGERLEGVREVRQLGDDWAAEDLSRRKDASLSVSIVLSMPPGTDLIRMRDAARAFARDTFAETFDYAFALHTDAPHPHVHLAVRSLGEGGRRLSPRKADLAQWRDSFAQALRDRGVAAEATLRRTRGVTKKAERTPLRKMRERHEQGLGALPRVLHGAYRDAADVAYRGIAQERPWEERILQRQRLVRSAYAAAARALAASLDPAERHLAREVARFLRSMPPPVTRRNELVRAMRALGDSGRDRTDVGGADEPAGRASQDSAPRRDR